MGYPQPNFDNYVAHDGAGFFRLNTQLISDGDIYESPQGSQGLAIGPDSDISRVSVGYFDEQNTANGLQSILQISPRRPFPGQIAARNEAQYAPSGIPGRILFWPDELFDVTFTPTSYDPGAWRLDFELPVIDVVEYSSPLALNNGQRNDKQYHYDQLAFPDPVIGGFWGLLIPFYGRAYAHALFTNRTGNDVTNYAIFGLTFGQGGNTTQRELLAAATVANDASNNKIIRKSVDGVYDYLLFQFGSASAAPAGGMYPATVRITTSDTEV